MPTFGVCLGHQGIGQHFGATVGQLPLPEHGKCSQILHNGSPMFDNVEREFEAGRYHSLYLVEDTVPEVVRAMELGCARMSRAELLAALFNATPHRSAVGGAVIMR